MIALNNESSKKNQFNIKECLNIYIEQDKDTDSDKIVAVNIIKCKVYHKVKIVDY